MRRQHWIPIAGLLAGVFLLVGATVPAFPDLTGHSYELPIRLLARRGVVQGFSDGTFRPYQFLTRAEFAKLLGVASGRAQEAARAAAAASRFSDLSGHWSRGYVEIAAELGLLEGFPDGTFRPDQPVTRAELVVIAARAAGLAAKAQKMPPEAQLPYRDAADIPGWARPMVWAAYDDGLLEGLFVGRMLPQRGANRAEAAALVARLAARWGRFYDLSATVVAWDAAERLLTLETAGGERRQLRVAQTAFLTRNGIPSESIEPLDQVWLALGAGGEVEFLEVRFQDLLGFNPELSGNELTFVERGRPLVHRVTLTEAARIFVNGRPGQVPDLLGAQWVYVVRDAGTGAVRAVDAVRYTDYGFLTWVDPQDRWVGFKAEGKPERELQLAWDAPVFYQGRRVSLGNLPLEHPVMLEVDGETIRYLQVDESE